MNIKKTILIVDDDDGFLFLMRTLIKKYAVEEYDILTASDGEEALEVLAGLSRHPAFIFVDINMPAMNGPQFLDVWHEKYNIQHTEICILTTSDSPSDRNNIQKYDFVSEYLVKPISIEKLQIIIN